MNKQLVFDLGNSVLSFSTGHDNMMPHGHCHAEYELIFTLFGRGLCTVEGVSFSLAPGSVLLVPPYKYHTLEITGDTLEGFSVTFTGNRLSSEVNEILTGALQSSNSCAYLSELEIHNLSSVLERLKLSSSFPERERDIFVNLVLSEVLVLISATHSEPMLPDERDLGILVMNYINENIDLKMSLDRIAKRFFVSKFYLCRVFKERNGVSVHSYINTKRLAYAKSLIENGESASGAAYKVGFGDYSAFYRAYVKAFGHSPTEDSQKIGGAVK